MTSVILVIHLIAAVSIVCLVLLQRSEGGGLGIGSSGGGMGSFATARATADFLTRLTAVMGAVFFVTSLSLAVIASRGNEAAKSILDVDTTGAPVAPIEAKEKPDAKPVDPSVPVQVPSAPVSR